MLINRCTTITLLLSLVVCRIHATHGLSVATSISKPQMCDRWMELWSTDASTCPLIHHTSLQAQALTDLAVYRQLETLTRFDQSASRPLDALPAQDRSSALAVSELVPGALVHPHSTSQAFQLVERIHSIGASSTARAGSTQLTPWHESSTTPTEQRVSLPLQLTSMLRRYEAAHELTTTTAPTATISLQPLFDTPASAATTGASGGSPCSSTRDSSKEKDHEYELRDRVGRGHFGELWRAKRVDLHGRDTGGDSEHNYILKRLFIEKGFATRLSGRREVHFGMKLAGVPGVARLIEWFDEGRALWLVFRDEGISVTQWLFHTDSTGLTKPSENWTRMRMQMSQIKAQPVTAAPSVENAIVVTSLEEEQEWPPIFGPFLPSPTPSTVAIVPPHSTEDNDSAVALREVVPELPEGESRTLPAPPAASETALQNLADLSSSSSSAQPSSEPLHSTHIPPIAQDDYRSILFQLLTSVAKLHEAGVIHRDLKTANLLLRVARQHATTAPSSTASPHLRICDFGSSIDSDPTLHSLLYPAGYEASKQDNTIAYSPPEVLFSSAPYDVAHPRSYDLWSVGIVGLEMLLGGRENVWRIDERVRAKIERRVEEEWRGEQQQQQQHAREKTSKRQEEAERQLQARKDVAVQFHAFIEYRVFKPVAAESSPAASGASEDAEQEEQQDDEHFQHLLQQYDPLGVGAPNLALVNLIRHLLRWSPEHRISAADALKHPYFGEQPQRPPR